MAQFVDQPLGVHLRQRQSDYLLDSGLGYTMVKNMVISPVEAWHNSPWNPLRPPQPENRGQYQGTAAHVAFLDGMKMYQRLYGVAPCAETHPNALDGVREMMDVLRGAGLTTTGLKPDLIARLLHHKVPVEILDVERAKFARSGKLPLKPEMHRAILQVHAMAMRTPQELLLPDGSKMTIRQALKGALNEVSVFWVDDNGIRQRARFDFLKPLFTGDLKTITEWGQADFRISLLREIILRGYMIQVVHYDEARRQLRKAVDEGRVFGGTKTELKLLERIAREDEWGWMWIFAKMAGAPQVKGIVLEKPGENNPGLDGGAAQYLKAEQQRNTGLLNFQYYRDWLGLETPWFDTEIIWTPQHTDWPSFSVLPEA